MPGSMDMVYWSISPIQKCLLDGIENYGFFLVCLMENGYNTIIAQTPQATFAK
jgi:hypothetical protein